MLSTRRDPHEFGPFSRRRKQFQSSGSQTTRSVRDWSLHLPTQTATQRASASSQPELNGKRLEILIEAVPGLRRMAALADVYSTSDDRGLEAAARERNVALSIYRVAKGDEIVAAIDTAHASGATALNVMASPILYLNRQIIIERVAALRLPAMYQFPEIAEQGGFAAYGPRLLQLYGEVLARQLAQLFRGTKVADIPIEQPTKFELVINLKTANALGITVPATLVARADKVIE